MAKLGWGATVGLAVGASAGTAAAQFGLGYGLGIIAWAPSARGGTPDDIWLASLAWTVVIAATSTVIGAVWADRRSAGEMGAPPRHVGPDGRSVPPGSLATATWRALLAFCAAVGALISVVLVLVPARAAVRVDTSSPQLIAAGYAVVGVVIGILVAVCALAVRAIMLNVVASAAWLWLLAIAAAIDGLTVDDGLRAKPLAAWPFGPGTYFRTTWSVAGTALMFGAALLLGVGMAWIAERRKDTTVGIALSGAVGPLMVAAAYLLTAPRLVGVRANAQISAYLTAPYAVIAGLAGSVLVVVVFANRAARRARSEAEEVSHAGWAAAMRLPPGPRAPSDATATSSSDIDDETLQLTAGKDTPGRLPTPPVSGDATSAGGSSGSLATATSPSRPGEIQTGTASGGASRPSPKQRRRPGRR